jgi:hypothetical protein
VLSGVAGNSRILADGLGVMGFYDLRTVGARLRVIRFGIPSLLVGFAASYWFIADPPLMLVLSGVVALFVYPSVAVAALWFRYRRLDVRILPGRLVTAGLWISAVTLLLGLPLVTILLMYRRLAE